MYESVSQANIINDARAAAYNGGSLRIYSGARPANVAAGVSGTLLAQLTFGATAFGASSNRVLTANAITQDSSADATGTAGYAACFTSGGTLISLHSLGLSGSGAECIISATAITAGMTVTCSSMTITQPDGS